MTTPLSVFPGTSSAGCCRRPCCSGGPVVPAPRPAGECAGAMTAPPPRPGPRSLAPHSRLSGTWVIGRAVFKAGRARMPSLLHPPPAPLLRLWAPVIVCIVGIVLGVSSQPISSFWFVHSRQYPLQSLPSSSHQRPPVDTNSSARVNLMKGRIPRQWKAPPFS